MSTLQLVPPPHITDQPQSQIVPLGATAVFQITGGPSTQARWYRSLDAFSAAYPVTDGETPWGSVISGSTGQVLTIQNVAEQDAMQYVCDLWGCGDAISNAVRLRVFCARDFNHDGDVGTDADIDSFFRCLAGDCCPTCDSADFNGDGDFGTDQDIEAFFRVLAGGPC
jgi:hypothetical protein